MEVGNEPPRSTVLAVASYRPDRSPGFWGSVLMTRPLLVSKAYREKRLNAAYQSALKLQAEINELTGWFSGDIECAEKHIGDTVDSLSLAIDEIENERAERCPGNDPSGWKGSPL